MDVLAVEVFMPGREAQVRWLAPVVPMVAATAAYAWARWCFASASPPSQMAALVGGAILILFTCVVYFVLVDGSGGFFGVLLMTLGLFLTLEAVEEGTARSQAVTCDVREVTSEVLESSGEGSISKTVYHVALGCPGGYPTGITEGHPVTSAGKQIRIAYDPRRRVSPTIEGNDSPWRSAISASVLLVAATALAARRRAPDAAEFRP
ncbi:hypothetical protein [Streptomyces violascens]|uniref:hypothetical protein n=1 Tax=Streptomyces violascens TaxID=67381 RepID=UPI0036D0B9D7